MQGYIVMCTHIVSLPLLVPPPGLLVVGNLPYIVLVKREHAVTTLHRTLLSLYQLANNGTAKCEHRTLNDISW